MSESEASGNLAVKAQDAYATGQYILSADLYAREADACKANGNELQAAENLNNCSVAFLQAGKAEAAYQAVADTPAIFENAGDIRRQAMALGNRAAALEELRRLEEALHDYQHATELLKGSGEDEMRALLLKRISTIQFQVKKPLEALFAMDAAAETSPRRSWSERLIHQLMKLIKKRMGIN